MKLISVGIQLCSLLATHTQTQISDSNLHYWL